MRARARTLQRRRRPNCSRRCTTRPGRWPGGARPPAAGRWHELPDRWWRGRVQPRDLAGRLWGRGRGSVNPPFFLQKNQCAPNRSRRSLSSLTVRGSPHPTNRSPLLPLPDSRSMNRSASASICVLSGVCVRGQGARVCVSELPACRNQPACGPVRPQGRPLETRCTHLVQDGRMVCGHLESGGHVAASLPGGASQRRAG